MFESAFSNGRGTWRGVVIQIFILDLATFATHSGVGRFCSELELKYRYCNVTIGFFEMQMNKIS